MSKSNAFVYQHMHEQVAIGYGCKYLSRVAQDWIWIDYSCRFRHLQCRPGKERCTLLVVAHLWDAARLCGVLQLVLDQVRQDIPRADAVACDVALLSHLKTNSLGKARNAVLGCIVGALVRRCDLGMHGASIDDSAPFLFKHVRQGSLCGMEGGVQADIHDCIPFVLWEVLDWGDKLNAYVVDQNVQPTKVILSPLDHVPACPYLL